MTDLPFLKENSRFFAARPDELHYRGRATHAFKLNNVGELEIAESALKFFRRLVLGATQQLLDQIDKIPLHQRLLEKMNRAESGDLFPLLRQMNAGQNDRAGIRVARPQIVKKILAKIRGCIDVENKKFGLHSQSELLRRLQTTRHLYQRVRSRLL